MADAEDALSLADIGRQLGVSRERARQLEVRAKKKLRTRIEQLAQRGGWNCLTTRPDWACGRGSGLARTAGPLAAIQAIASRAVPAMFSRER